MERDPRLRGGKDVVVIAGMSGAGKNTTINLMREELGDALFFSISATTRAPRPGEQEGKHYYFVSTGEFVGLINRGELLEFAEVHGNYYGTPIGPLANALAAGKLVVLDIDVQGVKQALDHIPDACFFFLYVEDEAELRQRLEIRGDAPGVIATRIENAREELTQAKLFISEKHHIPSVTQYDAQGQPATEVTHLVLMQVRALLAEHARDVWGEEGPHKPWLF